MYIDIQEAENCWYKNDDIVLTSKLFTIPSYPLFQLIVSSELKKIAAYIFFTKFVFCTGRKIGWKSSSPYTCESNAR